MVYIMSDMGICFSMHCGFSEKQFDLFRCMQKGNKTTSIVFICDFALSHILLFIFSYLFFLMFTIYLF